jgi:hypothetical protein
MLNSPRKIAITWSNNIFILDENIIKIFDPFGNGLGSVETEIAPKSISIIFSNLTINSEKDILSADLKNPELKFSKLILEDYPEKNQGNLEIVSALIFNNKLYVLSLKEILVYTK